MLQILAFSSDCGICVRNCAVGPPLAAANRDLVRMGVTLPCQSSRPHSYLISGEHNLNGTRPSLADTSFITLSGINCVQRCFALDEFDSLFSVAWMGKISVVGKDFGDRRRSMELR